jgi:hypothetical protein
MQQFFFKCNVEEVFARNYPRTESRILRRYLHLVSELTRRQALYFNILLGLRQFRYAQ